MWERQLDNITVDDLQEQHKQFAEVIGIENMIALSRELGGSHMYIPQIAELLKLKRNKAIFDEFTGDNKKELAKKYSVSESTIYNIIKERLGKRNIFEKQVFIKRKTENNKELPQKCFVSEPLVTNAQTEKIEQNKGKSKRKVSVFEGQISIEDIMNLN